jgi:hypothetical protein
MKDTDNFDSENIVDEIFVEITQDDLCEDISKKANVSKEVVKEIIAAFVKHQIEVMDL